MLNRRTLRIKVMQALYAYHQAVGSDFMLANDRIAEAFAPDLTSPEPQDRRTLQGQRKMAEVIFKEWHKTGAESEKTDDSDVNDAVEDAIKYYQKQKAKDATFFAGQMVHGAESIHDQYIHLLNLPEALLRVIEEEKDRLARRFTPATEAPLDTTRFEQNAALQKLLSNKQLQDLTIRRSLKWNGEEEMEALRKAWRSEIKADAEFQSYLAAPAGNYAEDQEILKHLFKEFVFKGESLPDRIEEDDLNWEENRSVVKNLVVKTLKMLDEQADENMELMSLSANWQDDKEFAETLYKETLQADEQYEKLIEGSVQNWDVERVALIDKIILKMALCEMHLFRSIPVKVTINEYIEISKLYSTPKSKQFVNGILDKLAQDLTASGAIRKSGRGLLDNQ
ncbi:MULTISPECIES: transcription antitermination factor NusB [Hymenobacter]|uniref:Transcription antitermination protein NusB n=1 Tax=Hymenobacter jejuensis TaxID=2502781 RepID=A0A5B7ZZQ4_9BACT|nr:MULTISPECIES: transcription antitermination factor NusB [Hymenobacter]MBC6991689.1 transcription antitermination factor NusB [Hymenobacter sp. BT491]QDA60016.1 transcription antitermination factor NusB [Hymenobacter jejuensis]